jgi:Galactosyltransferase
MLDVRRQGLSLLQMCGCVAALLFILLLVSGGPQIPPTQQPSIAVLLTHASIASDDYHRLMDLPDFQFEQTASCPNGSTPLVVVVHSAPDNEEFRDAIRSTWGGVGGARVLFMVGRTSDWLQQRRLDAEGLLQGDLVQGSFHDSYRNLTYKHVMALKWVRYHCPEARYVLKTDDDVFVHLPDLLELISNSTFPEENLILCDIIRK